ncbi:MAG: bifunctional diaminohydroxyphosphoribosylaminopyrimidine deaminase/5-amino-6-(5-phosphoribosylamino)uracil reductase RibD [Desulfurella sp.]|uniref:bifunctional diaminohydroxyphosphoribosylaminopyrimidine deaminase/5-amino-6-(5-phosphoribosylamino)uracil reductase RibD n=1 Tax=Desulfurella TaxID=33001 RepID=UPI00235518FC|nr:bifunctional diaminohydroxyphosphoribosylaminopyrimidine deaminase/5-amino-6-(5-phosphoribosylamino)uracil reductase RibD [Desulfurella multipotens]
MDKDELFMKKAIELAKKGLYKTCPNPAVGAVIVKDGKIIGKGYHKKAGTDHAEVVAIKSVKDKTMLDGATMYVTLEPCNHYGKTPPCSIAILNSNIKRVVIGMLDVNKTASGGAEFLKSHGIEVVSGILEKECRDLNKIFITNITKQRPFYAMKAAMLLNGCISIKGGVSKYITSTKSLEYVHRLRSRYNGVLVGINTVLMDDPLLNCRLKRCGQPKRIVLDAFLKIPLSARIFGFEPQNIYIATSVSSDSNKKSILKSMGVNILECASTSDGIDLIDLSKKLLEKDICSVLVEGGSRIHGSFLNANLYDKVHLFYAPKITGSYGAFNVIGSQAASDFSEVKNLKDYNCKKIGDDIIIEGYF